MNRNINKNLNNTFKNIVNKMNRNINKNLNNTFKNFVNKIK